MIGTVGPEHPHLLCLCFMFLSFFIFVVDELESDQLFQTVIFLFQVFPFFCFHFVVLIPSRDGTLSLCKIEKDIVWTFPISQHKVTQETTQTSHISQIISRRIGEVHDIQPSFFFIGYYFHAVDLDTFKTMYESKCGDGFRERFLKICFSFQLHHSEPGMAIIYFVNMIVQNYDRCQTSFINFHSLKVLLHYRHHCI